MHVIRLIRYLGMAVVQRNSLPPPPHPDIPIAAVSRLLYNHGRSQRNAASRGPGRGAGAFSDTLSLEYPTNGRQVVMKIIKHSSQAFPTTATGSLVGMDVNGTLQVTNSFPFPTVDIPSTDGHQDTASNIAAAAPRAKANVAYQNEYIKFLREVNVDANNVGWYTSTNMGNFVNLNTIENQYFYQNQMNERTVALVHDVSRSSQGSLSIRAFRLSPSFMAAYKEGKFTTER